MRKIIGIAIIILILTAGLASADTKSAILQAYVRVLPVIKHTILHQETEFTITEADITKGYVDVPNAIVLSVKTNSSNGYLLLFSVGGGFFNELIVYDGDNTYILSEAGGELHMPYQGMDYVIKELSLRFRLLPDAKPGTYPLPVAIMVSAM
jgi:hypothetical protein